MEEIETKVFEEKVLLAESCGLTYTNEFDENGEPIFIGTKSAWDKYEVEKNK